LLAWSKDDPVIPYGFASSFTRAIPSMKLVTYESGGHSAGPKNADSFAPLVIEFLLSA
jgi:pimeloyl-ACP methyl ester carboxylesterase